MPPPIRCLIPQALVRPHHPSSPRLVPIVQRKILKGWRSALPRAVGLAMIFSPVAAFAVAGKTAVVERQETSPAARFLKAMTAHAKAPPATRIVWDGRDVDGDGAADFENPTGHAPRATDAFGCGEFGASRDGGVRHHEGVDYVATAGQVAAAPISGFVTKIGYAYSGDNSLQFVEITNPAIGYVARAFYVQPGVVVGQALRMGDAIGRVASLQSHYPGITDHVHLEILAPGGHRIDATGLILARAVPVKGATAKG